MRAFERDKYGTGAAARSLRFLLGGQPTRKNLGDEKSHALATHILEIIIDSGVVTRDEGICAAFNEHCENRFAKPIVTARSDDEDNFLSLLSSLSKYERDRLEVTISLN